MAVVVQQPTPSTGQKFRDLPVVITDSSGNAYTTELRYVNGLLMWVAVGITCFVAGQYIYMYIFNCSCFHSWEFLSPPVLYNTCTCTNLLSWLYHVCSWFSFLLRKLVCCAHHGHDMYIHTIDSSTCIWGVINLL